MCKSDEKCVFTKSWRFFFVVVTITLPSHQNHQKYEKVCKITFFRNTKNCVGLLGFAAAGAFFYVKIAKSRGSSGICCRRRLFLCKNNKIAWVFWDLLPQAPFFCIFCKTTCFWWPINAAGAFFL